MRPTMRGSFGSGSVVWATSVEGAAALAGPGWSGQSRRDLDLSRSRWVDEVKPSLAALDRSAEGSRSALIILVFQGAGPGVAPS
jgi:hypothetical protein